MSARPLEDGDRPDPPALVAALAMLRAGLRPIPIYPGQKKPIGEGWGLKVHTEATLREQWRTMPGAGLGILLGADGGVVDVEVDDEVAARPVLARLFPDGDPDTLRFRANIGTHYLFRFDPRLARYGQTILKGEHKAGKLTGNRHYLGLEIRIGTIDPACPVQEQSVIPPTPRDDGQPRQWVGPGGSLLHPEAVFADPSRILPLPESVFADLDRFARPFPVPGPEGEPEPTWDADEVKAAILPHALALAREWGLRVVGGRVTSKGFWTCRAIDREDREPSAGFNERTGVYTDRGTGTDLSLFQLAIELGAFQDFPTAVNCLGRRFGVPPATGRANYVHSVNSADAPTLVPEPEEWLPVNLRDLPPVPEFPLGVFPESLATLCREGMTTFHCPADYFAATALGLAGGVIGRTVALSVSSTWEVTPNLFVAVVGPPGSKKSPALKVMARPLWLIDRELREEHQRAAARHRAEARKGEEGDPPVPVQLALDDTTREAFADVHSKNLRGLVLIKDELTAWVAALNAYRQGKGDDKQFWMGLISGAPVKVNRKGNPDPLVIPHPCGAVVGCLTPSTLPAMKEGRSDDGWIDRLLFSYPDPVPGVKRWTNDQIAQDSLDDWDAAIRRLWARRMFIDEARRLRPFFVHLTPAAWPVWEQWYNAHQEEQADPEFPAILVGPWSKIEGFTLRFALILSQLRQAYDPADDKPPRNVEPLDVWDACKLAAYFKAHFRRAHFALSGRHDVPEQADAILRWIQRHGHTSFTGRDISRQFTRFLEVDRLSAISWLISRRVIREAPSPPRPPGKRGRSASALYEVNPNLGGVSKIDRNDEKGPEAPDPTPRPSPNALTWLVGYLMAGPAHEVAVFADAASAGLDRADILAARDALGTAVEGEGDFATWKTVVR